MEYTIGVDIGTTSVKAVLFDPKMNILKIVSKGYSTYHPKQGFSEQDPEEIYAACMTVIKQLRTDREVVTVSFSSAMHGLIAMDENDQALTNVMIWSDTRAQPQVDALTNPLSYYEKTGTPVHPMSPFAKLLWLREETDLLQRTKKFIGIKEFIFQRLIGEYVVDYSIASATGLFNIHQLIWDADIMAELGLRSDQLSEPVDVTTRFGIYVIGASDGCLANLGSDAVRRGETSLTIGTSGAIRMTVDRPLLDPKGRTFCYYLKPGKWVIGGAVNNGGNVLEWLNGILFTNENEIYAALPDVMAKTGPGADGLFFYPYLNGERAPFWNGDLRASFSGLSAFHNRDHLIRAAFEGVLFNLKEVLRLVTEIGGPITNIKASGGFLQSEIWTWLAADILGYPLLISESQESSSLGAVLLVNDYQQPEGKSIPVDVNRSKVYQNIYRGYIKNRPDTLVSFNLNSDK